MKRALIVLLLLISHLHTSAGEIDTLSSKESVRKFLAAKLSANRIYADYGPGNISQQERIRMYFSRPDTIMVEDPVTRQMIMRTVPRDTGSHKHIYRDTIFHMFHFDRIAYWLDNYSWDFHKKDIDRNGLTDLVIDASSRAVFVVIDKRYTYEGHLLSDVQDFSYYSFRRFTTLPDGSTALLLKHNPCTLEDHTQLHSTASYITDTIITTTNIAPEIKIDTLYKIITVTDIRCGVTYVERDTVDMKRYNVIDTIVYKFNGFAKYNPDFKHAVISKMSYHVNHWSGSFEWLKSCIEVQRNGRCFLQYEGYDTIFYGNIDTTSLSDLWNFTSYLDIKSVNCGNNWGCALVIHFEDGSVKQIVGIPIPVKLSYQLSDISRAVYWRPLEKCFDCYCKQPVIEEQAQSSFCECGSPWGYPDN